MILKVLSLTVLTTLVSSAWALPNCKIQDLRDAQNCMDKVAEKVDSYEEENDGMASDKKQVMIKLFKAIGYNHLVAKIEEADFVGAVLQHQDEHHMIYYTMKKGDSVKPVELYDLNLVDLGSMLESKIEPSDVVLGGSDLYDIDEDIAYALEEFGAFEEN